MSIDDILETVRGFPGALVLAPAEGGPHPEIAWGDYFFYYAPDGVVPQNIQPYATIVTKDYPDDASSRLGDGRWRVNIHVGTTAFESLLGVTPQDAATGDAAAIDTVIPHPVYGALGWVSVINPGERTMPTVLDLLHRAHDDARARADRRGRHPSH